MTPAGLLRLAAADITPATWGQGAYHHAARSCAVGHLVAAEATLPTDNWICPLWADACRAVEAHLAGPTLNAWNDTDGRTAADVRALFLCVADTLESQP